MRRPGVSPVLRRISVVVVAMAAMLAIAACGEDESTGTEGSAGGSVKAGPAGGSCDTGKSVLPEIPEKQRKAYENAAASVQVCESPYATWLKPPKGPPPWTIGYAGTYSGNTWRQLSLKRIQALADEYKEAGLVDKLIVTDSAGDPTRMIQQLTQMMNQGVDAILTTSPPPSAINGTLEAIHAKKIPFVSIDGDMTSPYYLGTGGDMREAGIMQAEWLVKKLGGKGNVLAVNGIPGIAASDQVWQGADSVFKQHSGIKVVGSLYGQYTESVAKSEILKFLSTNPGKIDGVFVQGSMEMAAIDALEQTGRPLVPITFGGATNVGAYWRENPDFWDEGVIYFPTIGDTNVGWEVMMRTLQGQGPKIISMMRDPVKITHDDLEELVPADATTDSTEWMDAPEGTWWTKEDIDAFFNKPADPLEFEQ